MKIIKNTTLTDIDIKSTGDRVPASGQIILDPRKYPMWASDDAIAEVTTHINSGDIVIADDTGDLTVANGISLSRAIDFLRYPDSAFNIRFLSETERANGFTTKNVQEAIEELKGGIGSGGSVFFFNAAGTEDKWLQVSDHHSQPSGPFNPTSAVPDDNKDIVPFIVPHFYKIISLTFVNKKDNAETDLEIYKNGTLLFTWQVRTSRWRIKNTSLGTLVFSPGDKISVFAKKVTGAIEKPDNLSFYMHYSITKLSTIDMGDSDFV